MDAEHADGEEEPVAFGCDPAGVIEGEPAGWEEAVRVRMKTQVLRPGMQNGEHSDPCPKTTWIGGDLQQRLGSCAKQIAICWLRELAVWSHD